MQYNYFPRIPESRLRLFLLILLIWPAIPGFSARCAFAEVILPSFSGTAPEFPSHGNAVSVSAVPDSVAPLRRPPRYELFDSAISVTRFPKRIIDLPFPVSVISSSSFRFDRKQGSDEVLSSVPGLFAQSRYGSEDVRLAIRGYGSKSNSAAQGVKILIDDIPETEPDGESRLEAIDFNSVSRIEIVKGNSSSVYANAPGGVANFINDLDFDRSSILQFNEFGSFGLAKNGIQAAVKSGAYRFLTTYSYKNFNGYRAHNDEYWHTLNMALEAAPSAHSSIKVFGYYLNGKIKQPGSLTQQEFEADPFQADPRSVDRNESKTSTKARADVKYDVQFGKTLNNEIEVTTYGKVESFERVTQEFQIHNRYGLGLDLKYRNLTNFGNHSNEFSFGGDLYTQPERIEEYENFSGVRSDQIEQIESEKAHEAGCYFTDNFEIIHQKLFALLTGRYDNATYKIAEQTAPSRSDTKTFQAFSPRLALNYKIRPFMTVYASYGSSYDPPADNQLESPYPSYLYNQDLAAQRSKNLEVGIKGDLARNENASCFRKIKFELTLFDIHVTNEIVPYEVYHNIYFRNAGATHRMGAEAGGEAEIVRDLKFSLSYTYSYFRYTSYDAMAVSTDSTGNIITTNSDFSGHFVPSVPVNNLYMALSYQHSFRRIFRIFAKADFTAVSSLWVNDENSEKAASYALMNSVAGFDARFGHFSLAFSAGVNNIFNERYVGFTNTNSADRRYYNVGAPRNVFVTLNLGYVF